MASAGDGLAAPLDFTGHDLGRDAQAVWVLKRPVPVQVRFAEQDGSLPTLEGPVRYRRGDALLTGDAGDRWPVSRDSFDRWYAADAPGTEGNPGVYRKRPQRVLARHMTCRFQVRVGWASDPIVGEAGDWLLMYGPDDHGVVEARRFDETYEVQHE